MKGDFYKKLGAKIREQRRLKNLSIEKFAELADMNAYYLGEIERGEKKVSLDFLMKICNVLEIKLHELVNLD